MRKLIDSDLFINEINKGNSIMGRVTEIISGAEQSTVILNEELYDEIKKRIIDNRKEKATYEMGNLIMEGKMILFTTSPDKRLPDCMPFIVFRKKGEKKVAINLANIVIPVKNPDKSISYELGDASKVYSILYGAYLALTAFDENAEMSPTTLYNGAVLWAAMFNKPIYDAVGMNNPDRNDAYMYFAMKFFLGYIMGCNKEQINSIAGKYIRDNKNELILYMEEKIEEKEINIYEGIIPFMKMLFNNEITQIKGIRVANVSNTMNISFYLSRFVTNYSANSLLALCTFPYFVYTVIAAMGKSRMVKDKSFDRVFKIYSKELNSFLVNITRE